jgi:rod shape determining protein RodA
MFSRFENIIHNRLTNVTYRSRLQRVHLDGPLLLALVALLSFGLAILCSASHQNETMLLRQGLRICLGLLTMFLIAQIPPAKLRAFTPLLFGITLVLLLAVMFRGAIGKGAQRWLDLWVIRFQPSELLKLSLPLMLAGYLHDRSLPPSYQALSVAAAITLIPVLLVAKQPDLGTAVLILMVGGTVLLFSGIRWQWIVGVLLSFTLSIPVIWHMLHDYQRSRVLVFLYPESDPLGSGYHIIQSKIAIGSGGLFGKGWFLGTQSHLHFLPEHATDFIFAVCGEEFGLVGCFVLLSLYLTITLRGLLIAAKAQDNFSRWSAGSLTVSFFIATAINIGMVSGILPVVGLPLPLISYGGTSIVTMLASFGVLMSIHCHRKLLG